MKKIFTLIVMLAATLGMQAQDTWTVAGEKIIAGENWDPAATVNDMTSSDGTNFTLVKTGMMVAAKQDGYGYKVVKNHSWDNENYPEQDAKLVISEDAEYKITFTFNADTKDVNATAEKTGTYVPPVPSAVWTIAGVAELCGSAWDPKDENNNMTTEDGVTFKWSKTDVPLNKGTAYGFKACPDHDWAGAYGGAAGGQTSDNYEIIVDKPGLYTVEIILNVDQKTLVANTTWTADHEFGEKVWTIVGVKELTGFDWVPKVEDKEDWTLVTENDMTKVGDGEYELVKTNLQLLVDKAYEYKVAANHSWSECVPSGMENNSLTLLSDDGLVDGLYDVTFVFLSETKTLEASAAVATGINSVKVLVKKSAPIYNLQGQRVDGNYRGIAIQNGRKVVVK